MSREKGIGLAGIKEITEDILEYINKVINPLVKNGKIDPFSEVGKVDLANICVNLCGNLIANNMIHILKDTDNLTASSLFEKLMDGVDMHVQSTFNSISEDLEENKACH